MLSSYLSSPTRREEGRGRQILLWLKDRKLVICFKRSFEIDCMKTEA
jgi:hypothetical protein